MQQIKDLVATDISRGLFEKIQKGLAIKGKSEFDYYVSSQGNDADADGTEQNPFKTIHKTLQFIYEKHPCNNDVKMINIVFLTDFTDTSHIVIDSRLYSSFISFRANNKNVILSTVKINNARADFRGIKFKPKGSGSSSSPIAVTNYSTCNIIDCTFLSTSDSYSQYIICTTMSTVTIQGDTVINIENTSLKNSFISVYNKSTIAISQANLILQSNMTVPYFYLVSRQSEVYVYSTSNVTPNTYSVTGKKYLVNILSNLNTIGRGDAVLFGNQAGAIEKDGKIY